MELNDDILVQTTSLQTIARIKLYKRVKSGRFVLKSDCREQILQNLETIRV